MLQLITPTGDRPRQWDLCQRYIERQTYAGHVEWHVVDDGFEPMPATFRRSGYALHVHRLPALVGNSQHRNLLYLLACCDPLQPIAVIEDDDWYAPDWLETVACELDCAELVGESDAAYYNVGRRVGRTMRNHQHASLCATALRGPAAYELFREACRSGDQFIDMRLWRTFAYPKRLIAGRRVVGIKGMSGRAGIGHGHSTDFRGTADQDGRLLREWIGSDADLYLPSPRSNSTCPQ
jgi:hypothetical protein